MTKNILLLFLLLFFQFTFSQNIFDLKDRATIIKNIQKDRIENLLPNLMQETGIDIQDALSNSAVIFPTVLKAKVTNDLFLIGFIPGLLAMFFGSSLAGRGIFKRSTARLFKELEV